MHAGRAIRQFRRRIYPRLTQAELGKQLGKTQQWVARLEARPDVKLSTLVAVAGPLGVSPEKLFKQALSLAGETPQPGVQGGGAR